MAVRTSHPPFGEVSAQAEFPLLEEGILKLWEEQRTFEKSVENRTEEKSFVFYDGPPFASGLPHYGHLLASIIKDVVPRFWTMRGYRVYRRFGWDCHGLPVENEAEQQLGLGSRREIIDFGVGSFNESCRDLVLRFTGDWRGPTRNQVYEALIAGDPPIYMQEHGPADQLGVDPFNVAEEQLEVLIDRLREELTRT